MSLVDKFLKIINTKENDVIIKTSKLTKTYRALYEDIQKTIAIFSKQKVQKGSKALLFVNMSYEMYVSIFACILYGIDVVVIDNFKDKDRVNKQLESVNVDYVVVNNITNILTNLFKPLRKVNKLNVQKALKQKVKVFEFCANTKANLITFTSGGTGIPKAVSRSLDELENQLNKTIEVVGDLRGEYVLATLPIYALACIIEGIKIYIPNKCENLNSILRKEENTVMFSSISNYLKLDKAPSIKRAFFGGSMLYYKEAMHIKTNLPNAIVTYIYGATEASIISYTTLDEYINNLNNNCLCLGDIIPGNQISVNNEEIIVSKGIITNNYLNGVKSEFHPTKDLGYVKNNQIFLTGRKINEQIRSDYLLEMIAKKTFNEMFPIAILKINDEYHIYLEEKDQDKRLNIICTLEQYISNGQIHIVKKLPLDYRHHAKIDYKKLLKMNSGDKNV